MRTSNCYTFASEARNCHADVTVLASKGNLSRRTRTQGLNSDLFATLSRLKGAFEKANLPETQCKNQIRQMASGLRLNSQHVGRTNNCAFNLRCDNPRVQKSEP